MDPDAGISPYLRWVHDHAAGPQQRLIDRRINDHGLFFVRTGMAAITVAGRTWTAEPGALVLVRPHLLHSVVAVAESPLHMLNIHFDVVERPGCERVAFFQDPSAPRRLEAVDIIPEDPSAGSWMPTFCTVGRIDYEQLFRRVLMLYPLRDQRIGRLEIKAAMLDLLAYIRRVRRSGDAEEAPSSLDATAQRTAEHIQGHYAEPLTVAGLARAVHAGRSTLMRAFRASYGTTPMAYLRGVRIASAKQQLLLGALPPKAIADAIGFRSVHHFTRIFSAATGFPPAAFRRRFAR